MRNSTVESVIMLLEADGGFDAEVINDVRRCLECPDVREVRMSLSTARKVLGVSRTTLWRMMQNPYYRRLGLIPIRQSRRKVFVPRSAVALIANDFNHRTPGVTS